MRNLRARLALYLTHRWLYPRHSSRASRRDPTYGRIDRDIQWFVNDIIRPSSLAVRTVAEINLQARRDRRAPSTTSPRFRHNR